MNCEICGSEIKGEAYKTKIDNSIMSTCKECSRYGKVQYKPQPPKKKAKTNNKTSNRPNNNRSNNYQPKKSFRRPRDDEYELVEDYNRIIRQTREQKGLTQKKLGEKIYERESVVAHIETGKMVPDTKIARKIEKALNIKIIEKNDEGLEEFQNNHGFKEATIGDIARIKRK